MPRATPTSDIRGFFGDHRWLSNFAIEHDGLTVEHRYQAAKAQTEHDREWVMAADTPKIAKLRGGMIPLRADWDEIKLDVMLEQIRRKFSAHPFRWMLTATAGRDLVESNTWGDTFWGVDEHSGQGKNHLGLILMRVRDELITEAPS